MNSLLLLTTMILTLCATALGDNVPGGIDPYDLENRVNRRLENFPEHAREMPPTHATLTVDPQKVVGELPPHFVGYNLEDLSYEIFPGLSAGMLYGESFEDEPDVALPQGWQAHLEPLNADTPRDPAGQRKWRGAWSLEDGVLTLVGARQRRIWNDAVKTDDGVLECEVLQPSTERDYWGPGLLLHWGAAAYYSLQISPERGLVILGKGTERRFLQSRTVAVKNLPIAYDQWHKVRFEQKAGRLTVSLDGQEIISYQDPEPLAGGCLGLDSSFTVSRFRSVQWTPAGGAAWQADFSTPPYSHQNTISRWWDAVNTGTAQAQYAWSKETPYNTDRCQQINFGGGTGTVGVANTGLHNVGIAVQAGWKYGGRLYLRGNYGGTVTLALQSHDGTQTYATQKLTGIGTAWKRFEIALPSNTTDPAARFALWINEPGTLCVDQVILLPDERGLYHGLPVRRDLAEKMTAGIGHIRFGGDMINAHGFDWRQMTGDPDKRRQYHDGWNYHKSAQFMIFEFLDFCRAANVEPLVNLPEHLKAEDVAAFVEYCNGSAATPGGQQRLAAGRAASLGLRRVMYGNGLPPLQECEKLIERLSQINPQVHLIVGDIGHVPWVLISQRDPKRAEQLNRFLARLEAVGSRPEVNLLGSHVLWEKTMNEAQRGFPGLGQGPRIYAEEINGSGSNWQRGLGDALQTITAEKRGNLVWGMAFCNALQASGHLYEWNQGHIHFTAAQSWYQPSGHVVRMIGESFQPIVVPCNVTAPQVTVAHHGEKADEVVETPAIAASATRSRDGKKLVLKIVNLWGGPVATKINLPGLPPQTVRGQAIASLHLAGRNTAEQPNYIAPHPLTIAASQHGTLDLVLEPVSFTLVELAW